MASIASVISIIEQVQAGELTEGTETSASVFINNIILILTNSVMSLSITETVTVVTSVTKVSTLTSVQSSLLVELGKITLVFLIRIIIRLVFTQVFFMENSYRTLSATSL